ncbi:hypothetical protein CLU79DRAFT_864301 [Phycomyces nitens]|nr:hypothetical protein CLU79DRAFT_880848 [Phycomyces nitens]KAI9019278.1 hypothetical protein CLU79DRAFT_864301 [Phycomyces nitens]
MFLLSQSVCFSNIFHSRSSFNLLVHCCLVGQVPLDNLVSFLALYNLTCKQ